MNGLSVSRLVRVAVNLAPLAAQRRSFGILMIAGDSDIIDAEERFRSYTSIDDVAADFGTVAPEYLAAALYFGQSPMPQTLMIGRWLRTATAGFVKGAALTVGEQVMTNWTVIETGAFDITIDSVVHHLTDLNFSNETTLNGVAEVITNALSTNQVCTWDGSAFRITSASTGVNSKVYYATAPAAGLDISGLLKLTAALAFVSVDGIDTESPVACATALANASKQWYGLTFAAEQANMPTSAEYQAVGAFIEAALPARILGITETDSRVLSSSYTSDLASVFKALLYNRTCIQYSQNPYAVCSLIGRAFSVEFTANKSTITLMYKVEPGVLPEYLTETEAQNLTAKRCNVYTAYQNDTYIIQNGVMSGLAWFDERHGLDWYTDALQNALFNLLYQSKTKIPQTDAGMNQIVAVASSVCAEAVNNGLCAPGQWNADGFGQIERGTFLKAGFYIYAPPMALQAQADREARKAPVMQIALKLAGAIQSIDVTVDVSR